MISAQSAGEKIPSYERFRVSVSSRGNKFEALSNAGRPLPDSSQILPRAEKRS